MAKYTSCETCPFRVTSNDSVDTAYLRQMYREEAPAASRHTVDIAIGKLQTAQTKFEDAVPECPGYRKLPTLAKYILAKLTLGTDVAQEGLVDSCNNPYLHSDECERLQLEANPMRLQAEATGR